MKSKIIKLILVAAILFFYQISSLAQIKAITDTGDEVILLNDKTWKFKDGRDGIISKTTNSFYKGSNSTFLIKSKINGFGVYINPQSIEFKRASENNASKDYITTEYNFTDRRKIPFGLMVNEPLELTLESIRELKLKSMKNVSSNLDILNEEYRIVNGINVIFLKIKATVNGMGDDPLIFCIYLASKESSTTQLICYTRENDFQKSSKDIFELLNGLSKFD